MLRTTRPGGSTDQFRSGNNVLVSTAAPQNGGGIDTEIELSNEKLAWNDEFRHARPLAPGLLEEVHEGGLMLMPRFAVWMFSVGLMIAGAGAVSGQTFPSRTIRIVTAAAGGGSDFVTRLIAKGMEGPLGKPVIVENRATAAVGDILAQAPPDGHTLATAGNTLIMAPFLRTTSYDVVRDFLPITLLSMQPNILVVHPSLPVKSVKELIALANARPGELNYSSSGVGGSIHLAGELFIAMAGVKMVHVPFKGSGPAFSSLVAGEVQLMFATGASVRSYVESGRLRALAVTSAQPTPLAPGLPTVAASGLPGYESTSILGAFAPAKTPATIIDRLNQEIVRVLNRPDIREKLFNSGVEAIGNSPQQFAAFLESEMARIGKVIKDAGIKTDH